MSNGNTKARVFLVEAVRKDFNLESLKAFGVVTYLFHVDERRGSIYRTDKFCAEIKDRLKQEMFNPQIDFFCLTGGLVSTSLALSILARMYGTINLLLYNTGDESYLYRRVIYED